jgi:hypothetical protein
MSLAASVTEVVSRDELLELADLETRYAAATKAVSEVERALKAARLGLAEKVLGEAAKDLRLMDPEHLEKLTAERARRGFWKCSRNTPPFLFLKTSSGRHPAWRQIYVEMNGEAAAEKITAETPIFYSYRVDVAI